MGLNSSYYYDITCNAKVDNLRAPVCPAISDGALFDAEEVIAKAKANGWTETANGKGWLCPMHSAPAPAKRTPKPREQILEAAPEITGGE